jgi:hypothetical protein
MSQQDLLGNIRAKQGAQNSEALEDLQGGPLIKHSKGMHTKSKTMSNVFGTKKKPNVSDDSESLISRINSSSDMEKPQSRQKKVTTFFGDAWDKFRGKSSKSSQDDMDINKSSQFVQQDVPSDDTLVQLDEQPSSNLENNNQPEKAKRSSSFIEKSLKQINLNSLSEVEGSSTGKKFNLDAKLGVSISQETVLDPTVSSVMKVLGINVEAHIGASLSGEIEVKGKTLDEGKVELSFTSTTKTGVNIGASVSVLHADLGVDHDRELSNKVTTTYVFKSKEQAKQFLDSMGKDFTPADSGSAIQDNQYFLKGQESEKSISEENSNKTTKIVKSSTGKPFGISDYEVSTKSITYPDQPGKLTQEFSLETSKGGAWKFTPVEIPTTSFNLSIETENTNELHDSENPLKGKTATLEIELNLSKVLKNLEPPQQNIQHNDYLEVELSNTHSDNDELSLVGKGHVDSDSEQIQKNINTLTDKITGRLETIINNANAKTDPPDLINTEGLRDNVANHLNKIFQTVQGHNFDDATGLMKGTFNTGVVELSVEKGENFGISFKLVPDETGKKFDLQMEDVSLNSKTGVGASVGIGDFATVSGNIEMNNSKVLKKQPSLSVLDDSNPFKQPPEPLRQQSGSITFSESNPFNQV